MLTIAGVAEDELLRRAAGPGIPFQMGPFTVSLQSRLPAVLHAFQQLYAAHACPAADFIDFHLQVERVAGPRRWLRSQVQFWFDGSRPFKPLPLDQGFAMFEWGLNWCIANHAHQYLLLHAAVLEKNGRALVMPGPPGAGKSTLCAALATRGWRLFSDELGLVSLHNGMLVALARPVNLKNASIDIMQRFAPHAVFGPLARDTVKGTVAHMRPSEDCVVRMAEPARPGWVVVPRYQSGVEADLQPQGRARSFMTLAENAFNYHLLGTAGFDALADLVDHSECYSFTYSRLEDAIRLFDALVARN